MMTYDARFKTTRQARYLIVIDKLHGIRQRLALARVKEGLVPVTKAESLYACGYREARYPMPAIPYEIQYDLPYLLVWDGRLNGEGKVINPDPVAQF